MINNKDSQELFQLRALKSAKVSEISEATSASPVPIAERVNFHIGNPVQDPRLVNLYYQMVTGIQSEQEFELEAAGWESDQEDKLKLIREAIQKSVPYLPRGGYLRSDPGEVIKSFQNWLTKDQPEPLQYDFGEKSGKRECIIASGGIYEVLRVILHSISDYLIHKPARIFYCGLEIPDYLNNDPSLQLSHLNLKNKDDLKLLTDFYYKNEHIPVYLILGHRVSEIIRREIRQISLSHPLMIIEANDAPNHLSLAREAKMHDRVIRLLSSSAIFSDKINLPISFIAGNADYLRVFENVHFELKGTPPAAEVELLSYLIKHKPDRTSSLTPDNKVKEVTYFPVLDQKIQAISQIYERVSSNYINRVANIEEHGQKYIKKTRVITDKFLGKFSGSLRPDDPYANVDSSDVTNEFLESIHNNTNIHKICESFLSAFISHHPQYDYNNCFISSGSSRTALSLLGYQCDINTAIVPDLSWTYHHCFPEVISVPLSDNLMLDEKAILNQVDEKSRSLSSGQIAVIFNNPHNASGKIFDEFILKELLIKLLSRKIFVIDDLSYENVVPGEDLNGPRTLKQIALDLSKSGMLNEVDLNYLISVHSLSKTDCFAGARLSVIEINHPDLYSRYKMINKHIIPNFMAIFLAYLFYRNSSDQVKSFWTLRNLIMNERMNALEQSENDLPKDRNLFQIKIIRPQGSMYPHLVVTNLPKGISLDWLASGLARRGIGLVPLTAFSQTGSGYELARKTFRLTLGGTANHEELYRKTRRVLIDLNRLIKEESTKYNMNLFRPRLLKYRPEKYFPDIQDRWNDLTERIFSAAAGLFTKKSGQIPELDRIETLSENFINDFLPSRLKILKTRFGDQVNIKSAFLSEISEGRNNQILSLLEKELYKENIEDRSQNFRNRLFDRTVHPTQNYALEVDLTADQLFEKLFNGGTPDRKIIDHLISDLVDEYLGLNVPIRAVEEGNELVMDLKSILLAEEYTRWNSTDSVSPYLLSFWGDWDGSTRPSGQGHLLVSAVLLENVRQLADLVTILNTSSPDIKISPDVLTEIHNLESGTIKFWQLLHNINILTNQLEKRFRSVLPFNFKTSKFRRIASRYRVIRDPLRVMWQHNDRLEKKMLALRLQRHKSMEYYFALNKRLRKLLFENLSRFDSLFQIPGFALKAGLYRSPLRRFNLTPRIHQNMLTSIDQFAIDTTVYNMMEINEISGKYGNPGMILALQISMSDKPEALIALDRKIRSHRENLLREQPDLQVPNIWLIPLFEDVETVNNIDNYLNRLWEYSIESRRIEQDTSDRFAEMVCEIFIAGSDLSQQVSQSTAAFLYKDAKLKIIKWLAEKGLSDRIRIKLGSGEPMQRQGGYYKSAITRNPFLDNRNARIRMNRNLSPAAQKSTEYAKSPLQGIMSGGDLRTYQSRVFEKLKFISTEERARLLYHVKKAQEFYQNELFRISEPFLETRLAFEERGFQELERLSFGQRDPVYADFTNIVTQNFRRILYGSEEDVVGIHVISYFISRTTPVLRDRPTVRPSRELTSDRGQRIIQRIAQTLPLARHGTLLRAIGHNRAQTLILGINQLTTGLFRALDEFAATQSTYEDGLALITDRILPNLPVQEILHSLRIYHDISLTYLKKMARGFPAGNSAFLFLREDLDSMSKYIGLFQKEFLRRHGLNIGDFFEGNIFKPNLLPALTPSLAVLLQPDIFNTSEEKLIKVIDGKTDDQWFSEIRPLLDLPVTLQNWRRQIWEMIEEPIFAQVKSFVELAQALNTLTTGQSQKETSLATNPSKIFRMSSNIASLLRGVRDDSMRQFLSSVVEYLTQLPDSTEQVPINILRALEDIETIIKIEEQVLTKKEQDALRFYILQMARLAGENG